MGRTKCACTFRALSAWRVENLSQMEQVKLPFFAQGRISPHVESWVLVKC